MIVRSHTPIRATAPSNHGEDWGAREAVQRDTRPRQTAEDSATAIQIGKLERELAKRWLDVRRITDELKELRGLGG